MDTVTGGVALTATAANVSLLSVIFSPCVLVVSNRLIKQSCSISLVFAQFKEDKALTLIWLPTKKVYQRHLNTSRAETNVSALWSYASHHRN